MTTTESVRIEAAIELGFSFAGLYYFLAGEFPGDRLFWNQMECEEKNYTALLSNTLYIPENKMISAGTSKPAIGVFRETILQIDGKIESGILESRDIAFDFAFNIEKSASYIHLDQSRNPENTEKTTQLFVALNHLDINHTLRILDYWKGGSV